MDLVRLKGLDLTKDFQRDNNRFVEAFLSTHGNLTEWELMYAGKQTFSMAFDPLIDYINAMKKKKKDLVDGRTVN